MRPGILPGFALAALSAAALATPQAIAAQDPVLDAAVADWRAGAYDEALSTLARLTRSGAGSAATDVHARVLAEVGRYDEALELLGGESGPAPDPSLELEKGEILLAVGRRDLAAAAFRRAEGAGGPDRALARARGAELLFHGGERARAMEVFDSFIDLYNQAARLSAQDLLAVGIAVSYLGRATPVLFQDALKAFDEAAAAAPSDPRAELAIGDLFLGKYNSTEAHDAYRKVLEANPRHPDALLGEARALEFDGDGSAMATVRRALEVNESHVPARAFLARLHLKAESWDEARDEAEAALEVNPSSLDALAVLAAVHYLRGDDAAYRRTRDRALAVDPAHAALFNTVAELAVDHRKYRSAVELAGEAVARDSLSWKGWGLMGINRLRSGEMERGRAELERAFAGDPYNPWFKNTLDLLDTFENYRSVRTEHFELVLHGEEAALLEPYATALAEEAYAALAARYGAEPPTPIRLELFPRHADFSVRTLGLTGLGALGVSFGSTLVMDSPSAREAGEFNWASTLWHELAHAFHLGMTDHNVPRWFSEGLAVREQRVARPWWGHKAGVAFLQAYRSGSLRPVSEMNEGFVRPTFPGEVVLSYYQASLVFDWIEERWGFDAVRAFLRGYDQEKSTGTLASEVLGLSLGQLDDDFDDYVRERFAAELRATASAPGGPESPAGPVMSMGGGGAPDLESLRRAVRQQPGDFVSRLRLGRTLAAEGAWDEAEEHLRRALELFPGYGDPEGPLRWLARMHEGRGELREAADALRRLGELGESLHAVHLEEALLRSRLGDDAGERAALERAVEIFPYDLDAHLRLAALAEAAGDHDTAVLERRAVLGLEPADMADAHYRLARALLAAGHPDESRTQVLRALEIAPGFEAALELLLELRGGTR